MRSRAEIRESSRRFAVSCGYVNKGPDPFLSALSQARVFPTLFRKASAVSEVAGVERGARLTIWMHSVGVESDSWIAKKGTARFYWEGRC